MTNVKILNKNQLLHVSGGVDFNTTRSNKDKGAVVSGGCASINSSGVITYGLTSSQASGYGGVHWCCDSCGSATWYH